MNAGDQTHINIRFGIGKRLMTAFVIVGSLSILVSIVAWLSLSGIMQKQKQLTGLNVPAITAALSLANRTSQLVASAPLLNSVNTEADRKDHLSEINMIFDKALTQVNNLSPLLKDAVKTKALKEKMDGLPPLIQQLNGNVEKRLSITQQRKELLKSVIKMRASISDAIEPMTSSITDKLIETSDKWSELLSKSISNTKAGESFELDTIALETAPIKAVTYYGSVLEFKNGVNSMIGLLVEGSQSETLENLTNARDAFRSSVAAMVEPMGALAGESDITELSTLFGQLLKAGDRGDLQDNVLKLREKELQLKAEGEEILSQARALSTSLSSTVNQIVMSVQENMNKSIESSEETSRKTGSLLLVVGVMAIFISVAIVWFYVVHNLLKRLLNLEGYMQKIADGDLQTSINRNGKDEISRMGFALAILRNNLRETDDLKARQEEFRVKAEEQNKESALALANQFDSSVGQSIAVLSTNASDMRSQTTEMFDVANKSIEEVQGITSASEAMSNDISTVASATEELSSSVSQISHLVEKSQQIARQAVDRAEAMNGSVTRLSDGSKKIEQVIALINIIAEQTNLLALNATIEAARAGEAGKGFAVVASEVKNLSNQTSNAVDNIVALIDEIQKEVNGAVTAACDIDNVINQMDEISSGIASAVDEQASATREISQTVTLSSDNCNEIARRVQDVFMALTQANQLMRQVLEGATQVDQESSSLSEKVNGFLNHIRIQ